VAAFDAKVTAPAKVPLIVGNVGIVLALAWIGPAELGLKGLIIAGLVSMLLYNSCLFIGRRIFESRYRNGSQAISVPTGDITSVPRVKKALPGVLAVAGLVIVVIGGILPNRLPRDEGNMGSEAISWVAAAGFIYGAAYLDRKQRR
jgi:hypothetical protein